MAVVLENTQAVDKDRLQKAAGDLSKEDISQLVDWLALKENNIRYQGLCLLQRRSNLFDDVYPFWGIFRHKLQSENSYQRSIGLILIAENAKWDRENKLENVIDEYLELLNDEKPITIRQCVQGLGKIVSHKPELKAKIIDRLVTFDLMAIKETMRKSILLDLLNLLLMIRKESKSDKIDSFILSALSGGILDKKAKKQIEELFAGTCGYADCL